MMAGCPAGAFHRANALTYLSLLSGVLAMAASLAERPGVAGALIAVAVIADTFDGRFARLFARSPEQRAIGVQLDSLSDAIAFGIAPCICLAAAVPPPPNGLAFGWWIACFAFAACAITRLAFYNISHESGSGFIGLPVPVAALVAATVLLLAPSAATGAMALIACSVAMVLPLRIPRPTGYGLAIFVLWPVALVLLGGM